VAFNIKNEATIQRAREIAAQTGESIAAVFDLAVAERARRLERADEARIQRILRRANRCAARMSSEAKAIDVDELLYDERGLPK
jgi:hypothetical protein